MASFILIKNRSQIWSLDLMVAILIFLSALVVFYKYSINMADSEKHDVDEILLDAKLISSYLMSSGYPENWTTDNVTLIGLTDGGVKIIEEKAAQFSDIASSDYGLSRKLLSTMHNYYITFENKQGNQFEVGGVSSIGKNYEAENPKNLIKVIRFAFYNSTIVKLVVHVW